MPSGRTHYLELQTRWPRVIFANVLLFVLIFAVRREWIWYMLEFNLWSLFWFWSARYIDPDLDQRGITEAEGRMIRELGLVGVFLASYFAFYAHLMGYIQKRLKIKGGVYGVHRSKLTHSFWGTLIRIAFIDAPIPTLLTWLEMAVNLVWWGSHVFISISIVDLCIYLAAQVVTLGYTDAVHVWMDNTYGDDPRREPRIYAQR